MTYRNINIAHPFSTFSNLAYVIGGIIICWGAPLMQVYAGVMVILLGVSSGLYHWTDFRWAQEADIIAIFVAFNALFAWQLYDIIHTDGLFLFIVSLCLSVAIGLTSEKWHHEQIGKLAIWNLMLLFIRDIPAFVLALVLILVALAVGQAAEAHEKHLKDYDIPHAFWHGLTAISITLMGL